MPIEIDDTNIIINDGSTTSYILEVIKSKGSYTEKAADSAIYSCGSGNSGKLGHGNTSNKYTPTLIQYFVTNSISISQISAGIYHSIFLDTNGRVYSCGYNYIGQLGHGNTSNRYTPTLIENYIDSNGTSINYTNITITQISAGYEHSMFLDTNGYVYSCGYNNYGRLGHGDTSNKYTPTLIENYIDSNGTSINYTNITILQVSGGGLYSIFLDTNGNVYSCGYNNYGQLGHDDTSNRYTPTLIQYFVTNSISISQISAGTDHSIFLSSDPYYQTIEYPAQWTYSDTDASVYHLGNVGIGTEASATHSLNVAGDININNDIFIDDTKISLPKYKYSLYDNGNDPNVISGNLVIPYSLYTDTTQSLQSLAEFKTGVKGWRLVRFLPPNLGRWYSGNYFTTTNMEVSASLGNAYDYTNEFMVPFGTYDEMIFSTRDMTYWLRCLKTSVLGTYDNSLRPIISSSLSSTPYSARWYSRESSPHEPWITITDHNSVPQLKVYGENQSADTTNILKDYGGMCVFVRRSTDIEMVNPKPEYKVLTFTHNPTFTFRIDESPYSWQEAYDEAIANGKRIPTKTELIDYLASRGNQPLYQEDAWCPVIAPEYTNGKDWIHIGNHGITFTGGHFVGKSHTEHYGYPSWGDNALNSYAKFYCEVNDNSLIHNFTNENTLSSWKAKAESFGATVISNNFQLGGIYEYPGDGYIQYTLPSGFNIVNVYFGNPYTAGDTILYIDGVEKIRCTAGQRKIYTQTYTPGQILKIQEVAAIMHEDLVIVLIPTQTEYTVNFPENTTCDILVVGGGGGGGRWRAGGGGGDVLYFQGINLNGTYNINVGKGGLVPRDTSHVHFWGGYNGNISSITGGNIGNTLNINASGGAGAGGWNLAPLNPEIVSYTNPITGLTETSSGGGAGTANLTYTPSTGNDVSGNGGQGDYDGNDDSADDGAGGGGGGGGTNGNGGLPVGETGGVGGNGENIDITGTTIMYGRGGDGWGTNNGTPTITPENIGQGGAGADNPTGIHRAGGSGIVIIRYAFVCTTRNYLSSWAYSSSYDEVSIIGNIGINNKSPTDALDVDGDIIATSKSFKIEHPIVSNIYLYHACIEGPRYDNIYRGKKLVVDGYCEVDIDRECNSTGGMTPGTFVALNDDCQLYLQNNQTFDKVRGYIENGKIKIYCINTTKNIMVDWLVIGERRDKDVIKSLLTNASGKLICEH